MRPLEDIITEFEEQRLNLKAFTSNGDNNKDTLIEFQHRFLELKSDLRYWHVKMVGASDKRGDKSSTAVKYRISCSMVRGEYEFKDGEKPIYDKPPAIGNAEKFAAGTKEYKEFLEQRTFYKESLTNVSDLREDIQGYINLLKDKLKF